MAMQELLVTRELKAAYTAYTHMEEEKLPGGKYERNLIALLRNHVTYPIELLHELHLMSVAIVESVKSYDDRLLYNWKNYDEDEKKTLLILASEQANGAPVVFIDQPYEEGKEINGCYNPDTGDVELVHELVNQSLSQAVGTTVHEQGHALIARYVEQKPEMVAKSSGLEWSSYGACDDDHQNLYDACPEEALVRAVQMNALDMLAQGTNQAKQVYQNSFSKLDYDRMKSARKFFEYIGKLN